jgi:hypothetical protein
MYHLARLFPKIEKIRIPFSRDQIILMLAAFNEIILGADIYLAHNISGTIMPYEWIPIIFGPIAGVILLAAGLIALRNRPLATKLAATVFVVSILIGVLGSYFHLQRSILQDAAFGSQFSLQLLVWAPPIFGPIAFAGVGWLGLSAAFIEEPGGSGIIKLFGDKKIKLPYSKTRGYLFLLCLGILAALVGSVFDHARTGFENPWLWLPTITGIFAVVVSLYVAAVDKISKIDLWTFFASMVILMVVGIVGAVLHIEHDLTANLKFVQERFLSGAPFLAPLQYANLAMLGLVILLNPGEKIE